MHWQCCMCNRQEQLRIRNWCTSQATYTLPWTDRHSIYTPQQLLFRTIYYIQEYTFLLCLPLSSAGCSICKDPQEPQSANTESEWGVHKWRESIMWIRERRGCTFSLGELEYTLNCAQLCVIMCVCMLTWQIYSKEFFCTKLETGWKCCRCFNQNALIFFRSKKEPHRVVYIYTHWGETGTRSSLWQFICILYTLVALLSIG